MIVYNYRNNFSLVKAAHQFIIEKLTEGDIAIDATVGNGHDTIFLANQVGVSGKVFGFDIQETALQATRQKLIQAGLKETVSLHLSSHACMYQVVKNQTAKAIMFNLGYLPGGDKDIITQVESTVHALNSAIQLIIPEGGISIIAYPGHPGGQLETEAINQWCRKLDEGCFEIEITLLNGLKTLAPQLILISKKS